MTGWRARWAGRERPVAHVPGPVVLALVLALAGQIVWHAARPGPSARVVALPPAPPHGVAALGSLGDPVLGAKLLMLWLQAFDNQPGVSVPLASLDYQRVREWLDLALRLDPRIQYPLLAAARVYGSVADPERKRAMFEFVRERFLDDPDRRWPWLAHAVIAAKHQLHDLPLALRYARDLTEHARGPGVPAWARDMSVIVLQEMGELEAARILIGGLLESGRVSDPHEVRFLVGRLAEIEQAERAR
ncbi:MAG: hypothetical protein H6983_21660 [Ectothiorhodospiraceae bacterium]|nr:hypothetical protein [Chromatiales bacterium]MCP5156797.1 hypothetical protein [Ectothiorhodospiraceae bacterium]